MKNSTQQKPLRVTIGILSAFNGLTALGGGIAILTGLDEFPPEWLRGTPFIDYTIPALLLAVVVGGSALVALVMIIRGAGRSADVAVASGLLMAGYVAVEMVILKQEPPGPTPIELFYLATGLAVAALARRLRGIGQENGRNGSGNPVQR